MSRIRESKWNPVTKTGSYSRPIHHNEMIAGSKITNTGTDESLQNLASKEGLKLANKLLNKRKK